jgi:ABC-type transport system substrate-binding protein
MEAIDRAALERNVYMDLRTPTNTEVASVLWAHDPAIQSLPFNPRQAASDLDHAGWTLRDSLLNAAYDREYSLQQVEFDQQARKQAFFAMQQLVHDDYAYDFLSCATLFSAINPALQNWRPNMVYQILEQL